MNLLSFVGGSKISVVKNPFDKKCITDVSIHAFKGWDGEWRFTGTVSFSNGNTQGSQKFSGNSMNEVIQQIEVFLKNI